jgi:hypothetical protein
MFLSIDQKIPFVVLQNRGDGEVADGLTDMTWASLLGLLTNHEIRKSKNGLAIIPAKFKPQSEWVLSEPMEDTEPTYRNANNIESITMAIIDLDNPGAIDVARKILSPYEHVIYSTHSYTIDSQYKFRAVVKLEKEIPAEDWPLAFQCLVSQIDADKQCGNLSRLYYLPSASPKANIKPVVHHNKGRALKYSDILAMAGDNVDLTQRGKSIERKERRHFLGKSNLMGSQILEKMAWTWESMSNRHADLIKELSFGDSRHAFAVSVTSSEVARYGERIDIPSVVQFLYKASALYSSRPMGMGNTHKELPELFHSSFVKYAKSDDALSELQGRTGLSLRSLIENSVQVAQLAQATGRWPIDAPVTSKAPERNVAFSELRRVYADDMREMIKHEDCVAYLKGLINTNLSINEKLDCEQIGKFFVETYTNFIRVQKPELNDRIELGKAVKKISESAEIAGDPLIGGYHRFINAALKKNMMKQYNNNEMEI